MKKCEDCWDEFEGKGEYCAYCEPKMTFKLSEKRDEIEEDMIRKLNQKDMEIVYMVLTRVRRQDKEFMRLLKETFPITCREHHQFHNRINKLSGFSDDKVFVGGSMFKPKVKGGVK